MPDYHTTCPKPYLTLTMLYQTGTISNKSTHFVIYLDGLFPELPKGLLPNAAPPIPDPNVDVPPKEGGDPKLGTAPKVGGAPKLGLPPNVGLAPKVGVLEPNDGGLPNEGTPTE